MELQYRNASGRIAGCALVICPIGGGRWWVGLGGGGGIIGGGSCAMLHVGSVGVEVAVAVVATATAEGWMISSQYLVKAHKIPTCTGHPQSLNHTVRVPYRTVPYLVAKREGSPHYYFSL